MYSTQTSTDRQLINKEEVYAWGKLPNAKPSEPVADYQQRASKVMVKRFAIFHKKLSGYVYRNNETISRDLLRSEMHTWKIGSFPDFELPPPFLLYLKSKNFFIFFYNLTKLFF